MSLKGPGMPVLQAGQRVAIPRAGGATGTVRSCAPLGPRLFEAIVDLDGGGWAGGLTACFVPIGDPPPPPGVVLEDLPHVTA